MFRTGSPSAKEIGAAIANTTAAVLRIFIRFSPSSIILHPQVLQLPVAVPRRTAFELIDNLAVRAQTGKCVLAPEGGVVAVLDFGVRFGFDVQALPAQILAAIAADFPAQSRRLHGS